MHLTISNLYLYAEKGKEGMTRDAGTQSTPPSLVSSNPSTDLTPSIIKSPIKLSEDSLNSNTKAITEEEVCVRFFLLFYFSRIGQNLIYSSYDLKVWRPLMFILMILMKGIANQCPKGIC